MRCIALGVTFLTVLVCIAALDVLEAQDYIADMKDVNLEKCEMDTVTVEHDENVDAYDKKFSEAFAKLSKSGGGTMKLQSGVYLVASSVVIPESCCIQGKSMKDTKIKLKANATKFTTKGLLSCSKSNYVSIMDLTIDGNKDEQKNKASIFGRHGLSIERCNYTLVQKVRMENNPLYGCFARGSKSYPGTDTLFEKCEFSANDRDGVKLYGMYNLSIQNSVISGNARVGASITGSSNNVLVFNVEIEESKYGVRVAKEKGQHPTDIMLKNVNITSAKHIGFIELGGEDIALKHVSVKNKRDAKAKCFSMKYERNVMMDDTKCEVESTEESLSAKCTKGIARGGVCCPLICGKCGGPGCAHRGRSDDDEDHDDDDDDDEDENKDDETREEDKDDDDKEEEEPKEANENDDEESDKEEKDNEDMKKKSIKERPCCAGYIRKMNETCMEKGSAPCLLSKSADASSQCKKGIAQNGVCCPLYCGKCGGVGCSKRTKDKLMTKKSKSSKPRPCCVGYIRRMNQKCAENEAPCVMS